MKLEVVVLKTRTQLWLHTQPQERDSENREQQEGEEVGEEESAPLLVQKRKTGKRRSNFQSFVCEQEKEGREGRKQLRFQTDLGSGSEPRDVTSAGTLTLRLFPPQCL